MTTAGAYLPWEGEVTTITKISKPNSPFHEARHQLGPAQEMMQNTLSITDKFASSGGPSSGDDGGWYQSGDMQWDVYVNPDFPSDIELSLDPANAGPSPDSGEGDPPPPPDVGIWWKRVMALIDARRVLRNDKDCAKFFGLLKRNGEVNERKLKKLVSGSRFMVGAGENYAHTDGEKVTLEQGFFNDGWYLGSPAAYTLTNPRQGRVQTILHELGHVKALLISPDNWGYPTDPNSPGNQNNKTILDHCGKGLAKVPDSYEEVQ